MSDTPTTTDEQRPIADATPSKNGSISTHRIFGHRVGMLAYEAQTLRAENEIGGCTHRVRVFDGPNFGISSLARRMGKEIAHIETADSEGLWVYLR